jgi:endo-1,4-beta-xylanase
LYINEYDLEIPGAKIDTAVSVVKSLLREGVPLHGIGFEGHMMVGHVPSAESIAANMERFTAMGLEVALTEVDIRMKLPATGALLEQQKADYQTMITACMMVEKCVGMTLWDYTDR